MQHNMSLGGTGVGGKQLPMYGWSLRYWVELKSNNFEIVNSLSRDDNDHFWWYWWCTKVYRWYLLQEPLFLGHCCHICNYSFGIHKMLHLYLPKLTHMLPDILASLHNVTDCSLWCDGDNNFILQREFWSKWQLIIINSRLYYAGSGKKLFETTCEQNSVGLQSSIREKWF